MVLAHHTNTIILKILHIQVNIHHHKSTMLTFQVITMINYVLSWYIIMAFELVSFIIF